MEDQLKRPPRGKSRANRLYYLRNREHLLAKARARYAKKGQAEPLTPEIEPEVLEKESPQVSEEAKKRPSLFAQLFQHFRGEQRP